MAMLGSLKCGGYFRYLAPTVMVGIVDFPEDLRYWIVVSDSVGFMSNGVLNSSDVSKVFTRAYR